MIPVRYHNKEKKKRKKTNTGILKSEMLVSVEVLLSKMPRGHFTLCKSTSAYITKLVRGFQVCVLCFMDLVTIRSATHELNSRQKSTVQGFCLQDSVKWRYTGSSSLSLSIVDTLATASFFLSLSPSLSLHCWCVSQHDIYQQHILKSPKLRKSQTSLCAA